GLLAMRWIALPLLALSLVVAVATPASADPHRRQPVVIVPYGGTALGFPTGPGTLVNGAIRIDLGNNVRVNVGTAQPYVYQQPYGYPVYQPYGYGPYGYGPSYGYGQYGYGRPAYGYGQSGQS